MASSREDTSAPPPHAGFLLGYSSLSEKNITEGIRRLATVLKGPSSLRPTVGEASQ